ncbi:MAG: BadF/BadG/BcrA/BcrD ATPase family protein [Armatimonadota bacterium]
MVEQPSQRLLLGVDGGATKTRAVVISERGAVLGRSEVRSSSAYHREPEEAAGIVVSAAREALGHAGTAAPVAALGAGLAGADDPTVHQRLTRALGDAGLAQTVVVDHDAAAALAGGTVLQPGIVIIAGTGSIAFGVDQTGRRARAGGWGPLLDDEGSGYAVGRGALRAAMRAHDGRGGETTLTGALARRFGLGSLASLKMTVKTLNIDEIASLAPLVVAAARDRDTVALAILTRAGEGLAAMIAAVARTLGWERAGFPLVPTGGMFKAGEAIREPMVRALRAGRSTAQLVEARFSPDVGAALLAAQAAGCDIGALIGRLDTGGA